MFGAITNIINNVKKINQNELIGGVLQEDLQDEIIDLNQKQLMDEGVQADGVITGTYSPESIERFGKRPGHITLYDTGNFYESMKPKIEANDFVITGDTVKEDTDLTERWPRALGLTKESISEMIPDLKIGIINKLKEKIFE